MWFWATTIALGVFVGNVGTVLVCLVIVRLVDWWIVGRDAWDERE